MTAKQIGRGLIVAGTAGIVLSLLIAVVLRGRAGIPAIPILTVEVFVIVVLCGIWLFHREGTGEAQAEWHIRDLIGWILNLPVAAWVFIGFLLIYLLLFVSPMFLGPNLQMVYFTRYIPNMQPIGNDLTEMVGLIRGWALENQSPYALQRFYPPLTYIFFTPLLLIDDPLALFRFFTLFTLLSYCLLTLLLPLKIIGRKHLALALLLFVTGLFSYGFQFELERGQYNVFAFLLCLTAIYIFHYHRRYRLLAYVLFSLSIQLKLYPGIFIVMFVDDWRDWKAVLRRFAGVGIFNVALFFVMGYQRFWEFLHSMSVQIANPTWMGKWNHSISSFVTTVKQDGLGLLSMDNLRVFRHNAERAELFLLLVFLVLFVAAVVIFHLRKEPGLDPYLLLVCTIGMLIIPISYDYTLSLLAAPMLLFLGAIPEMKNAWNKFISILLTLGISLAYFATLTSYSYRPHVLNNAFPLLFFILILVTILNIMRYLNGKGRRVEEEAAG